MWLLFVSVVVVFFATAGGPLVSSSPAATAVKTAHLLFFATSLGATVWAIFVGGTVMFLHLPAHTMGRLRGKIFRACFSLNAACTAVSAATFAWLHQPWEAATTAVERCQLGLLVGILGFDLANLLLFTPGTIKVLVAGYVVMRISDGAAGDAKTAAGPPEMRHRRIVFMNVRTIWRWDQIGGWGEAISPAIGYRNPYYPSIGKKKTLPERHKVERRLGMGDQSSFAGWRSNVRASMTDTSLAAANRRFWAAHNLASAALLASISGLAAHSWYLAGKLAL